MLIRNGQLKI